ncbi:MAG: hypothetical protein QOJ65_2017 [Fimbriimonadaceae bacterium]|jgi:glycosyltransferase involved in cell wall biosynthesis|nr:hypothetical protein [Fimbriimonadaceae bacterium]
MQPLVSIITPTYNHEDVLGECIRSVLAQTYDTWEMLIVDDGSTDKTHDVVAGFSDHRIRYLRQENKGVHRLGETYNSALSVANGEIIAILEGDDYWPADRLAVQVHDFEDDSVVLSSGFTSIVQDGKEVGVTPVSAPSAEFANNRPVGRAALWMMHPDNLTFTFPVSTMVRAETLRAIGGFQQPPYLPLVDFPTFLRLSIEGEFRFHERVLGYWRRHSSSVTQGNLSLILENAYRYAFEFLRAHRDRLPATDAELDALEAEWDERAFMRCILRGRLLARSGKRDLAAKAFKEALAFRHSPRSGAIARLAAALAGAGLHVEPIYKATGRVDLDEAITLNTGDRIVSEDDMKRERVVGRWRP